jgi:hypothetical protein
MRNALRLGQICLAATKSRLGSVALGALLGLAQGALHRWHEPLQSRLQNVVRRATFECLDRHVLANCA